MKTNIIILFSMLILSGAACKSKEKASNDSSNTNKAMQSDKKYRFVVSFFSIGTGVDGDAVSRMEDFVSKHPKKPAYETYRWGREGEADIAFLLKEFKPAEQLKFIEELKKAIGDSDRVRYKENEPATGKILKKAEK